MRFSSIRHMRELDRQAMTELKIPGDRLMETAARGIAAAVMEQVGNSQRTAPAAIHLFAGGGNNGGDAFGAARLLHAAGYRCRVWTTARPGTLKGSARLHYRRMVRTGLDAQPWRGRNAFHRLATEPAHRVIQVDGVLGTGTRGPAREPAADIIDLINERADGGAWTLAIDIPSGLNGDSGDAAGPAVRADATVTMGMPKPGLVHGEGPACSGSIDVVDLGFTPRLTDPVDDLPGWELLCPGELRPFFRRRPFDAHKGTYGHVLLIGGAAGYTGAMALAARAALRSGAGLVSVACPRSLQPVVARAAPEAMVTGRPETADGVLAAEALDGLPMEDFDAVLIGPGMTAQASTRALVHHVLQQCKTPLVLDADALNVLAGQPESVTRSGGDLVLTPHPGELGRLLGVGAAGIQRDRAAAAAEAVRRTGAAVVLKGAGTLVTGPGSPLWINTTGNPGMACGGSGDVLSGLLAGLLAWTRGALTAARAAVWLQGRAGDLAAGRITVPGMKAGDIIEALPAAWRHLSSR